MNKKYTKQSILDALIEFNEIHGRSPLKKELGSKNDLPSEQAIRDYCGSFNLALKEAGLKINVSWHHRTSEDKCFICGRTETTRWNRDDEDNLICNKCIKGDRLYYHGLQNPESGTGVGIITEHVVFTVLEDCVKCNTEDDFNAATDLISTKYGTINVKAAVLITVKHSTSTSWVFRHYKNKNTIDPDNYVCIGFGRNRNVIEHVWIIPRGSDIINSSGIHITNSVKGLERASQYEVDQTPYNKVYQELDIYTLPEFRNLKNSNTDISTSTSTSLVIS